MIAGDEEMGNVFSYLSRNFVMPLRDKVDKTLPSVTPPEMNMSRE